ncbi:MAG: radical SAM protein [Thermodesulfobacteriota bacterium]|nr:radical SAM protein [Thermodesulfobacteriota bacterium]
MDRRNLQNREYEMRLIFWETTIGCNLECIHCRRLKVDKQLSENDLTTSQAFRLLEDIVEVGRPIVILSGGEPLFRPDIFEIANKAGELGLITALATNGTLITEDIAKNIAESGIQRVSVSLDGAHEVTHDNFRKIPGSFKKAIDGLKQLNRVKISTQINSTITRKNRNEIKDLYNLALKLKAEALHFFMLVPVGCGVEIVDEEMMEPEQYEKVLTWLYEIEKEGKIQIKATCAPQYYRIIHQRGSVQGKGLKTHSNAMAAVTKGCLAGTGVCFISHTGEVFPCGYLPVSSGNITKKPLKEIWEKSGIFTQLRNPDLLKGKCGICEYKNICSGCRARAYYRFNDYLEEEPYCIYKPKKKV